MVTAYSCFYSLSDVNYSVHVIFGSCSALDGCLIHAPCTFVSVTTAPRTPYLPPADVCICHLSAVGCSSECGFFQVASRFCLPGGCKTVAGVLRPTVCTGLPKEECEQQPLYRLVADDNCSTSGSSPSAHQQPRLRVGPGAHTQCCSAIKYLFSPILIPANILNNASGFRPPMFGHVSDQVRRRCCHLVAAALFLLPLFDTCLCPLD